MERLSRTALAIGYGWEFPRKGEKENNFKRLRRQNKKRGEDTPVYPSLPPSEMSRAVVTAAIDIADIVLVTGTKKGHAVPFPGVLTSYLSDVAPEVPVENIGKAGNTSGEIRRYFKYLRKQKKKEKQDSVEGTIAYLAPHDERIRNIVNNFSKKRKNQGITINRVLAEDLMSQKEKRTLQQTPNYRYFTDYEQGGVLEKQQRIQRWHAAPLADYLFRFTKTNIDPEKSGVI